MTDRLIEISQMMDSHRNFAKQNPSREIQFMQAIRPFMAPEKQAALDNVINILTQMDALKRISGQVNVTNTRQPAEPPHITAQSGHIHSDGIYEMDEQCLRRKMRPDLDGVFMMMLLFANVNPPYQTAL